MKRLINAALCTMGARLVNVGWGPRGFLHSLRKLAAHGWSPKQIIDVGAWKGTWTTECMELFPDARYLLIDPLEENRAALVALTDRCRNVTAWLGAAGPGPGEISLNVHADQSSVLEATVPQWRGNHAVTVPMRSLDSFVDDGTISTPQLLKVDVQGYEIKVLQGAERLLRNLDAALLEVSFQNLYSHQPLAHDIVSHMSVAGFRIFDICSYSQDPAGELVQSDFLFVRNDWPVPRRAQHADAYEA